MTDQASAAGTTIVLPPVDAFCGDLGATLKDPYLYSWALTAQQRDVPLEDMVKAMRSMAEQSP